MNAVFQAIGEYLGNFPTLGLNIVTGLVKGVASGASKFINAIVDLCKSAWEKVKEFFGIKSPSRLAAEAGMYIDEGFAVGLKKYASVVSKAAVGVGKSTMDALNNTISGISKVIDSDIDSQPTIRPVLDLSDVKAGAGNIASILGTGTSVGVLANVGAISSSMENNQNGGTGEVVSAIDKLRKELNGVGNTTYNIDGVTYDDGSNVATAVKDIVRAARVERRR